MAALDETYDPIEGRCNSCRFYDRTAFGEANYGHCRRYRPAAVEKQANGLPRGVWPVVGYDDNCGEYRPRPLTSGSAARARAAGTRPGSG